MIMKIFSAAPWYAWPLLTYILYVGVKALEKHTVSVARALILPLIFFCWASYGIAKHTTWLEIFLLIIALAVGKIIGFTMIRTSGIKVDKAQQLFEIPGNRATLILALSIFSIKFATGILLHLHPELKGTLVILALDVLPALLWYFCRTRDRLLVPL